MTELKTVNPATGETLNTYPLMSDAEVAEAVKQCHEAYLDWRLTSHEERAKIINKVAEVLRDRKGEFAELMTKETGKLLSGSKQEIDLCAGICEYTAKNGPSELADETRDHPNGERATITYSPIGVVYGIQPWNFPAYQVIRYTIANLMTGNGVILKHASNCTGSGLKNSSTGGPPDGATYRGGGAWAGAGGSSPLMKGSPSGVKRSGPGMSSLPGTGVSAVRVRFCLPGPLKVLVSTGFGGKF